MPGMKPQYVLDEIKRIVKSETDKFKLIIDDFQLPYEIDKNHPMVKLYIDTVKKMGCTATLKGSEGATVITFFQKHKIPAFSTGYGAHGTAHTTDEYVKIDTLYKGTKILEQYVKEYDRV